MMSKAFQMTQQHLDLLRAAYVSYDESMHGGAPGIDKKRPFGNGDVVGDMAKILGIEPVPTDDGDTHWPPGTSDTCDSFMADLEEALQIVLVVGRFEVGTYQASDYSIDWHLV